MIDDVIDRADALFGRWHSLISFVGVAWFVASCADYAGFIDLPVVLPLSGWIGILPAIMWNALWWGVAYPRIEERRKQRNQLEHANG